MSQLVVPNNVREALVVLDEQTELRDENGKVLGIFKPVKYPTEWPLDGITMEELLRRDAEEPTGQTWAEIRRELEAMDQ